MEFDCKPRGLNDCGCCEGLSLQAPAKVYNRSGLSAIAFRVGTHAQLKQTLLARLSASGMPALQDLTTRDDDDFAIALIDAWAAVGDVLTFYQERIANELYLRTATERLSLLELARMIDYELQPGVAAGTYLAFTIEDAPGAFGQSLFPERKKKITPESLTPIMIDIGTKVQSVPGPGEQAQIFETTGKIEARAEWNAIRPRLTQPQNLSANMGSVILQGTETNLSAGETVLIIEAPNQLKPMKILEVRTDDDAKTTRIDFAAPQLSPPSYTRPSSLEDGKISDFPDKVELDGSVVADIIGKTWKEEDLSALVEIQNWSIEELLNNIAGPTGIAVPQGGIGVFAFRQRAAVFGYNAPKQPTCQRGQLNPAALWTEWPPEGEDDDKIFLDNAYDAISPDSYIAVQRPGETVASALTYKIKSVSIHPRTAYGISTKTTELTLAGSWWDHSAARSIALFRDIAVHAQSEQLDLADVPIDDLIGGDTITLDRTYLGLKIGKRIIIAGERNDLKGVIASEIRTLKDVIVEAGFTVITLDRTLDHAYVRNTVIIRANVAPGTHGESVEEILGSGDSARPFQRFTLRQPPLTYISAATSSGSETSLTIRVNGLLWQEVPSFYGRGPEERIYITRTDDDGRTTVMFGDGLTGARLPTGQENVKAKYRKGIGLCGLVKENQLSQLMTKPLGVKEVTNPIASSGAADREGRDEARRNAPLTVLTMGRIVSLQDYEDFARAFAGIDKALATSHWIRQRRGVFVTVAGSKGAIVKSDNTLYENLLTAIRTAGDPFVPFVVASYVPRFFQLQAKIQVRSEYLADKVLTSVEEKLRTGFSFDVREFGQPVVLSEVVSIIQNVAGVTSVTVDKLHRSDEAPDAIPVLEAFIPKPDDDVIFAAELLTLDPRPVGLEELS